MKHTKTLFQAANYSLAIAAFCFSLSGCKKDDSGMLVNNNLFSNVTLVTTSGSFIYPASAVPDATNQFLYFVASDSNGTGGVFKVPSAGGATTAVFVGAPLSRPLDVALSTDNQTLFIADSAAGAIFSVGINGSTPVMVPGTAGTYPTALEVIQRSGQDQIYFCGTNGADSKKAVFEIVSGGAATPIVRYKGAPLVAPAGIVSAKDGTLFIADGGGMVHKLSSAGAISQIASGIIMGTPAGIGLTPNDSTVVVSSKSPGNGTAQVQIIDLQTGSQSIFNKVIGANSNPGGLHPARNSSGPTGKYAWADAGRSGRVYRIDP